VRRSSSSPERSRPDYNFRQFKDAFHLLDDLKGIYQRAAKLVQIPE
jgi:hypothetical protein